MDKGEPLRAAMKKAGLDIPTLAAKTGLSKTLIGFTVGKGRSAREDCSDRAAQLIANALDVEVDTLFETVTFTLTESTSTRGTRILASRSPLPDRLMDQQELARFLKKSSTWIDEQIRLNPEWPGLIYAGRARRFDPYAVLDGLRPERTSA
ncbi:hypothetical protein [Streptomyces sp. IB2014 016-6]|uniref:hypothetical protein n=1 Tax=Streptomyces sp. IB2014 016-6 TaxID=2517818 RepID=UPI0011CA3F9B|nr:hypothetical protein [Streptomyces sp. IB2014 016-6]TXL91634.1 hypothetical protein EW053_04730 [Streptomyces sp. IB2014 016-6]